MSSMSTSESDDDQHRFVPGRVLIAGNKKCVNKCSAEKECRSYGAAAPEKKNVCLGGCHRECSVCPLSSVTNDCRKACESQCSKDDTDGVCWHACLERCPCEDLGDQLFDVLDMIPDFVPTSSSAEEVVDVVDLSAGKCVAVDFFPRCANSIDPCTVREKLICCSSFSFFFAFFADNDGVPVGINHLAESLVLQAALADKSAKTALLSSLRASETSHAGAEAQQGTHFLLFVD